MTDRWQRLRWPAKAEVLFVWTVLWGLVGVLLGWLVGRVS